MKGTEEELDQLELAQQVSLVKTAGVMGFDYLFELVVGRREVLDDGGSQVFSQPVKVAVLEEEDVPEGEDERRVGPRVAGQKEEAVAEGHID